MIFPLKKYQYILPVAGIDPGGFSTKRKYDIHTGIDLYCEDGQEVFSMTDGEVIAIENFTGQNAGSPWWEDTKAAYCLHPILQSNEAFLQNKSFDFSGIETESIILAMEYRATANSYLSKNKPEDFKGFSCLEVKQMLIADKVQNYKDFLLYHKQTHERSAELDYYFNKWFDILEIDYNQMVKVI